jgi:hypothetical protein
MSLCVQEILKLAERILGKFISSYCRVLFLNDDANETLFYVCEWQTHEISSSHCRHEKYYLTYHRRRSRLFFILRYISSLYFLVIYFRSTRKRTVM